MEIKFRAFDKRSQIMHYDYAVNNLMDGGINVVFFHESSPLYMAEWVLMQWSTWNDKNGTNIYAGDLIEVERQYDKIIVECKFGTIERQMATGFLVDITGFYLERNDGCQTFPIKRNYKGVHDLDVFTVIGNRYEQPQFLQSL